MAKPSDRELALAAHRGDAEAFGSLARRHQASVFNVCYRLLGERFAAEDLCQESLLRAYRKLALYDPERPFGPWVRRLATNLCYNHLQRRRVRQTPLEEERMLHAEEDHRGDPSARHARGQRAAAVRRALAELPPHYKAALELRHFQGLSYAEIAATLDQPLHNVKSHLYRGRRALERALRDQGWIDATG